MAAPIRTCIGCRRREPATDMVRLFVMNGQVELAGPSRLGRGASLHPRPACLETGLRPEVLSRAFKQKVAMSDAKDLLERITIASLGMTRKR
jgi:hypothetical protein